MNFEWLNNVNTYNPYTYVGTRSAIKKLANSSSDSYNINILPYIFDFFEQKILGVPVRVLSLDNEEECIEETHIDEESLEDFLSSFNLIKQSQKENIL